MAITTEGRQRMKAVKKLCSIFSNQIVMFIITI